MNHYRYDLRIDADGIVRLRLTTYVTVRETPCFYWLVPELRARDWHIYSVKPRRVSKAPETLKWCWPTKDRALISFICRTERRYSILAAYSEGCQLALGQARQLAKSFDLPLEPSHPCGQLLEYM